MLDAIEINTPKPKKYESVLANKNFLALWLAQVFSQLADRVIFVVFVAVIASSFSTATKYQSFLYIAFTIPAMLLTAVAGVFIDKWNKKYTLIITNILRAALILMLPLFSETLYGIYILAFLVSSVTQFFVPAEASSIPMMVKKEKLMSANSLFTATMMGSLIFGFVLGDPLIEIFGLQNVNIAISLLFMISAVCLLFIRYKKLEHEDTHHKTFKEFFDEFKEGFAYVKSHKAVLNALLKLAALFSIIVMMCILAISVSQQVLYPDNPALGAQKFVYIVAFSGIGMILGAVFVGKLLKNANKFMTIFTGFSLIGINLIVLSAVAVVPWKMAYAYTVAGLIGFGFALVAIPIQTILHSIVPERIRGKIFGIQFTLLSTASTLPIVIAAYAVDFIGVTSVLVLAGIPIALFGIWGMVKNNKLLREKRL